MMNERTIIIGCTYTIPFRVLTAAGAPYDMSSKTLTLRLRSITSTAAVAYERDTDTAAEATWTDQSLGRGNWLWKSNESLTPGEYDTDCYINDGASPTVRIKVGGTVRYKIVAPDTGSFS